MPGLEILLSFSGSILLKLARINDRFGDASDLAANRIILFSCSFDLFCDGNNIRFLCVFLDERSQKGADVNGAELVADSIPRGLL